MSHVTYLGNYEVTTNDNDFRVLDNDFLYTGYRSMLHVGNFVYTYYKN